MCEAFIYEVYYMMQIHKLLQGLPTIRSMVSLSSGAAKLVSMPLESYRKDHRLLKGMQRGKQNLTQKFSQNWFAKYFTPLLKS